ncbi:hypothetical protein [Tenacibaculum sp. M341]|uniref:hypothetical protein n=1 Tax=Tenacibaculum sp. M341 TaxID=2530339 RepID=UPI00104B4FB1|nr:hypothetical protein [Tenacibaculum sp. M341]TCI90592.1 hypothetical protein EYW44_12760 [Tenacibaculum sp. M341]
MKNQKSKKKIRDQILTHLKLYNNKRGILFFDNPKNTLDENISLENNEIEVLLIKLSKRKKVLITTKHVFIINQSTIIKIQGKEIYRFDYMLFENLEETIKNSSKLQLKLIQLKLYFRIGDYRIINKDGSFNQIKITKTKFADCLSEAIKKLVFVTNKYDSF